MSDQYDYVFKILIIGDSGTGKSSFILRYTDDMYSGIYSSTIGVDFKIRTQIVPDPTGKDKVVKLQIWDTAGQERFRSITSSYYRCANAILITFDLNNPNTFRGLDYWFKETENCRALKVLVGTKCDLSSTIDPKTISDYANQHGVVYMETSAKLELGVQEIIDYICKELTVSTTEQPTERPFKLPTLFKDKDKKCCS